MGYGGLREALSRELAAASTHRIKRAIGAELADDLEDLSGALKTVGSHVAKAAPGALKGAATGFLMGGPAGALAGAAAGGLSSSGVLSGRQGAVPGQGAIANPAALELLLTVLRPEVVDALIALALGNHGARAVPIAGTPVPVGAVTSLIQSLAEQASATHHASNPRMGMPRYLTEAMRRGHDIGSASVRAEAVLTLVHDAWDDDVDEAYDEEFADDIDEAAEAEDLADIYRLGGYDDE
jgi:hypothetical protein